MRLNIHRVTHTCPMPSGSLFPMEHVLSSYPLAISVR